MSAAKRKINSIDGQRAAQQPNVFYCKECIVSNQRPRLLFDENGVCSACLYQKEKKTSIDWEARHKELEELCNKYRRNDGRYDIVVPCSGGKDASYVAHLLKTKYGMHPLTVTWAPFQYTEIGRENHYNFVHAGFTNMMCWPNGNLHRKLARIAFEAVGDAWQPFTFGQVSYAFHIAAAFDIKLVFFGENGEAEYSGASKTKEWRGMPLEYWSEQYFKGVTVDTMIEYGKGLGLISDDDYLPSDLTFYRPPAIEVLKEKDIQFHWLGYYHEWVPQQNYYYCAENTGFKANPDGRSEGTYSKYASLDDRLDGMHYYLAFIKFGIGRCTSDAAHEVRDHHILRDEAVALVKKFDAEFPKKHFQEFLDYLGITEEFFHDVVDYYRPEHLWHKVDGEWKLKHAVWHDEYLPK